MRRAQRLRDADARDRLLKLFAAKGIEPSRVIFRGPDVELAKHLRPYSRIDVALDPYPYHGTTTTCDAPWMGVPLVTRAGDAHVSRVSASLLSAVGVPELIGSSGDEYIVIAAG